MLARWGTAPGRAMTPVTSLRPTAAHGPIPAVRRGGTKRNSPGARPGLSNEYPRIYKPDPVPACKHTGLRHLSGTAFTRGLDRPTRRDRAGHPFPVRKRDPRPIWSFSPWGLPCRSHRWERGGLLHHPFTHACALRPSAVCSLLHFPWCGRHRPYPFPLGSTVPYAARTFLPFRLAVKEAAERCAGCQGTMPRGA